MKLYIESLEHAKDIIAKGVQMLPGKEAFYADARIELGEGKSCGALNGNVKGASEDYGLDLGVRVYSKNNGLIAAGQMGKSLGEEQLFNLSKELKEMLSIAFKRSKANLESKQKLKKRFPELGKSIGTQLAEIEVNVDTVKEEFKKNPKDFSLEEAVKRIEKHSMELKNMKGMAANSVSFSTGLTRKIFASSEKTLIDQTHAFTQAFYYVVAKGKTIESFYDLIGENAGMEVMEGENCHHMNFEEFGKYLAEGTIMLSNAQAVKTVPNSVVITDPWYNALVSHEITGHPSEADRALKRETAWAGRAWWFKSMQDNQFGKQVASEPVSVVSDPTIKGYGHYKYDDEGTKAKKIYNIKNGILNEFLNSRETASILGKQPNGGMRANSAANMPIIRMNNTFFEPGEWKKEELFQETKQGFYAVGQKIPAIGETRQNFKISCWKLFEIKNGEIGKVFRAGALTADSYDYLKSIDAVADDFQLFNIPNCGKGTPMQSMKVGNGGPHMRGIATVTGEHN